MKPNIMLVILTTLEWWITFTNWLGLPKSVELRNKDSKNLIYRFKRYKRDRYKISLKNYWLYMIIGKMRLNKNKIIEANNKQSYFKDSIKEFKKIWAILVSIKQGREFIRVSKSYKQNKILNRQSLMIICL